MDALLLLFFGVGGGGLDGGGGGAEAAQAAEEGVVAEAREGRLDFKAGAAVVAEVGVGVLDVGGGEGLDCILEGCETGYDLGGVSGLYLN